MVLPKGGRVGSRRFKRSPEELNLRDFLSYIGGCYCVEYRGMGIISPSELLQRIKWRLFMIKAAHFIGPFFISFVIDKFSHFQTDQ